MNISTALKTVNEYLINGGVESSEIDAYLLLSHALNLEKSRLITEPSKELTNHEAGMIRSLVSRRLSGEPSAYITGKKEFYSIEFIVTRDVLIPRPETEHLVDCALYYAKVNDSVLDIGTGSGAIAVALKKYRPDLTVHACDISEATLNVARENAEKITGKDSVIFSDSDIFSAYNGRKFDIIVSNPPYIDPESIGSLQKEIFYEPEIALFSEDRGRAIINKIISKAGNYLKNPGILILEIGYDQDEFVRKTGIKNSFSVSIIKDYSNLPRVAVLKK